MKPGKELLFLALGGSGEIGMNVNLYGCDGKWLMVDLGMTFADPAYPGSISCSRTSPSSRSGGRILWASS
jgi:mRNA degradation ribonuclease J1/J2